MKACRSTAAACGLMLAAGLAWTGVARTGPALAQPSQDHSAHQADAAPALNHGVCTSTVHDPPDGTSSPWQ